MVWSWKFMRSKDIPTESSPLSLHPFATAWYAMQMLQRLRGRKHSVYSGVCLWDKATSHRSIRVDVSHLWMEPITDAELEAYLDTEQWVGKAGAFGFQDGPNWIRLETGSESNVVGLPMEMLASMLTELEW